MASKASVANGRHSYNGYVAARPAILGLAKVLFLGLCQLSYASAAPVRELLGLGKRDEDLPKAPDDPSLWAYLGVAAVLVLLGGAFAGLTIAFMGQDNIHLQVLATSSEGREQKNAQKVYALMRKGKHWVLVTLLLSNVVVNETLPIVLDRSLGGGWPAIVGSTVLIVIFGEVIPQAVCARHGLAIGAFMQPFVVGLMWILAPIGWPAARMLDWALGEDHGSIYKKSGLKTLVTLHKTLGTVPTERLNQDEVTIISAVLDLKDKAVGDIMTPMEDVFTMSADTVLDEVTMDAILSAGYSRIPIYEPGNEQNFVGMLLVKILITYDPEDCKKVSEFALATLPETRPETSCLDIVNFFQEGKSHMVLVSEDPGENYGAIGVVTLEDVIEELIGEEIIDESDVYIDVHKAIRRITPAPKARLQRAHSVAHSDPASRAAEEDLIDLVEGQGPDLANRATSGDNRSNSPAVFGTSPKATFLRRSSGGDYKSVTVRGNINDMREHLKHLGPSNLASRPKSTRYNTVKIKTGGPTGRSNSRANSITHRDSIVGEPYHDDPAPQGGEGEGLLSAGKDAKDGVQALQQGYGSFDPPRSPDSGKGTNVEQGDPVGYPLEPKPSPPSPGKYRSPERGLAIHSGESNDTLTTLQSSHAPPGRKRHAARSGSITENIIEAGGVRKVVLETTSSSEENRDDRENEMEAQGGPPRMPPGGVDGNTDEPPNDSERVASENIGEGKKKRRRTRHRKKSTKNGEGSSAPGGSGSAQ
ncbi:CBS-domain-containing protein [Venustampulla echinocandica]|uniref:CBS-domain-containing protein n=1 Tax=Venustampulla echinocandica TaxID=2656787 RepID=A0A370TN74_9HELO|nr:CBS-domain-containing protein [Venustampulla echinocandica]RDL36976.1 CBS-domain-containing protein [Venustampulla echinocandica]